MEREEEEEEDWFSLAGEVVAIFDMDGDSVTSHFRCKELGWKVVGHPQAFNFFSIGGV